MFRVRDLVNTTTTTTTTTTTRRTHAQAADPGPIFLPSSLEFLLRYFFRVVFFAFVQFTQVPRVLKLIQ